MALGNTDKIYCLPCLALRLDSKSEIILESMKDYINSRECFNKEWTKYKEESDCPEPKSCFPSQCFA
jgi:hypothetical protein